MKKIMDGLIDVWTDEWINKRRDGWTYCMIEGWADGWKYIGRRMNGQQMNGRIKKQMDRLNG